MHNHRRRARNRAGAFHPPGRIALRPLVLFGVLLAVLSMLPGAAASAKEPEPALPPGVVNTCASNEIFYQFRYNDSDVVGIDKGCATQNNVTRAENPALIATELHVSCSDKISADGVPTKSNLGNSTRRVAAYFIQKDAKKTCGFGNPAGPTPTPSVDLTIKKTASATTVESGQTVTYTLKLTNTGGTPASNVLVSDPLPAGTTYVSSSTGCSYNAANRTVTCDAGDLAAPVTTPVSTCTGKDIFYYFQYNDSNRVGIDTGCAAKNNVTRAENPQLIATELHVSCSDKISADGVPTKSVLGDPARRVAAYYIKKDEKKTCGQGTFTPPAPPSFTITVKVTSSHCNTATVGTDEPDSNPADNTSTVCVNVPQSQTLQSEIYLCVNGSPSTILVLGGELSGSVPAGTYATPNPLAPFGVPAGTYTVNAASPDGLRFVACGQTGVTIASPSSASQPVIVPAGGAGDGKFYVVPAGQTTQTIQGEIYRCLNGAPSTSLVPGGSIAVPTAGLSSANPLSPTEVNAGGYRMNATAPSGLRFVACGQSGVTIDSPGSANQNVTVPAGGAGDGKFYVVPITQTIQSEIYRCVNGAPSTILVAGGTLTFSTQDGVLSSDNPLFPLNVAAGSYSMRATAPFDTQFVPCGQTGVTIDSPEAARQTIVVPAGGAGDGKFYVVTPTTPTQTIQGEIYRCVNGAPSTSLVSGGTLAVPTAGLSSSNPLPATQVAADSYRMNAVAPSGQTFVACGQPGVTIDTPGTAHQTVTVPAGGSGDGKFYVVTTPPPTQTIQGEIYVCVNGSPSTTIAPGGTLTVPSAGLSSGNPLVTTSVAAGTYQMNAVAPTGQKFVACGKTGVTVDTPGTAHQTVTVPAGGSGDGKFYVTNLT